MNNRVLNSLIFSILILGIIFLGNRSFLEFRNATVCERFAIIPACYIAFSYVLFLFICQIFKKLDLLFLLLLGFAMAFVGFASIGSLLGRVKCNSMILKIPACYVALGLLFVLFTLKYIQIKNRKPKTIDP